MNYQDTEEFLQRLKNSNNKHEITQYIFQQEMKIWEDRRSYLHWLVKMGWVERVKQHIERTETEMKSVEERLNDYFFSEYKERYNRVIPPVEDYPSTLTPFLKEGGGIVLTRLLHISHTGFNKTDVFLVGKV